MMEEMEGEGRREVRFEAVYPSFAREFGDGGGALRTRGEDGGRSAGFEMEKEKNASIKKQQKKKKEELKGEWRGYPSFDAEMAEPSPGPATSTTLSSVVSAPLHEQCLAIPVLPARTPEPDRNATTQQIGPGMTDAELLDKRRAIELEMRGFQERLDHVALALAGQTPHQIEMRALRDEERAEREEARLHAREELTQQLLDRREHRQTERELRIQRRHSSLPPELRPRWARTRSGSEEQ